MFRGLGRWVWAGLIGRRRGRHSRGGLLDVLWRHRPVRRDHPRRAARGRGGLRPDGACWPRSCTTTALAANPITVVRAIVRVGWGYAQPCLVAGFAVVLAIDAAGRRRSRSRTPRWRPSCSGCSGWSSLYEAMVVLRVLGLFYHRHARELGWFRDRTGWGRLRWRESPGTTPRPTDVGPGGPPRRATSRADAPQAPPRPRPAWSNAWPTRSPTGPAWRCSSSCRRCCCSCRCRSST